MALTRGNSQWSESAAAEDPHASLSAAAAHTPPPTPLVRRQTSHSQHQVPAERTPLLPPAPSQNLSDSSTHSSPPASSKQFNMGALQDWLRQISVPVYLLVMVFAISSWIDINGVWVEVPLLVNELPESWNLPSYLVIIIQVANIGPITYTVANRLAPNKVKEWPVVYIIILVGAVASLLLSFFWRETTVVGGELHSTALLTLMAFLALVDCTSSVVYLPYMAGFKPQYMTAFYIGEGLGGLIPGLVGLIQGVGGEAKCVNSSVVVVNETTGYNHTEYQVWPVYDPPRFTVEVFCYFLFGMLCLSGIAFSLLHFLPYCQTEKIDSPSSYLVEEDGGKSQVEGIGNPSCDAISITKYGSGEEIKTIATNGTNKQLRRTRDDDGKDFNKKELTNAELGILLFIIAWSNGLTNGVLPSTQSYTCLPYGNLAYTLAIRLSTVANPLACFIALFAATSSVGLISLFTVLGTGLAAFQLYLAAMSPAPPLQYEASGEAIVILSSILITGFLSYAKVSVATTVMSSGGRRGLLWVGVVTQVGSFVGAVITFVCVTEVGVFTSMPPCPN